MLLTERPIDHDLRNRPGLIKGIDNVCGIWFQLIAAFHSWFCSIPSSTLFQPGETWPKCWSVQSKPKCHEKSILLQMLEPFWKWKWKWNVATTRGTCLCNDIYFHVLFFSFYNVSVQVSIASVLQLATDSAGNTVEVSLYRYSLLFVLWMSWDTVHCLLRDMQGLAGLCRVNQGVAQSFQVAECCR